MDPFRANSNLKGLKSFHMSVKSLSVSGSRERGAVSVCKAAASTRVADLCGVSVKSRAYRKGLFGSGLASMACSGAHHSSITFAPC